MKRFVMMALLCTFVLGLAATASAADIKVSGDYAFEAIWTDNWGFKDNNQGLDGDFANSYQSEEQDFNVYQRLRTKFQFIASENLKGVLYTEVGTSTWGENELSIGAHTGAVEVKQGYIDFNWPGTQVNVKVGYQGLALPMAVTHASSPILSEEVASATVSGAFTENVSYLVGYGRALQSNANQDQTDVYFAALPVAFDNMTLTPYFAYANMGEEVNATNSTAGTGWTAYGADNNTGGTLDNAWWAGLSFDATFFEDFITKADFMYGQTNAEKDGAEMSGWMAGASVAYTGWKQYVTPEVFFVYTTGEDGNVTKGNGGSERMPIIAPDWAVGSFFFGGDALLKGSDGDLAAQMGFWTLGLSLKDISFMEGLSHTVNVMYIQGTNDKDLIRGYQGDENYQNVTYGKTLTEEDSIWEVDFNSEYKIYDELTGYVQLGWLNADYDKNTWGPNTDGGDAYKLSIGMNYSF
ncbi:outer membrane homotrimeric porin [Salidesulfovibrio brasiliensis]|uniref:outer membrane homotrimeric porin n=1 Tax=Salidesulfovibrio brasiliensis TaxID=221711 RepID=UPI0006D161B5|nr:outer membrane homotrimeric porin [Salidesulfovibrio brasiliensis]